MDIRLAHPNEVKQIMLVINSAKKALAASGSQQWQGANGYPNEADIIEDILAGQGYVALLENQIVAYAAVIDGQDPDYEKIYAGQWKQQNHRYIVFHRIAVLSAMTGQKIAQTFIQGLIEGRVAHDFRCDTHEQNKVMQHILQKLGFVYCGKVPIDGERFAYQKIKQTSEKAHYQEINEASHHSL